MPLPLNLMFTSYPLIFWQLIRTPFLHLDAIWGIVPLYFGWILNEVTSPKASFKTAVQTGFSFSWAAAHWIYQSGKPYLEIKPALHGNLPPVNVAVTVLVLLIGLLSLVSGLRRKFPPYCAFLGHSRFSNYFMIAIFPIQSNYLSWSWERFIAIVLFALPVWVIAHFALMPWRK